MLHQSATDAALAGSTAESRQDIIERWITRSYDRIVRFHYWQWQADTRDFSWPAGTPNNGGVLYMPDYVYKLYSVYQENQNYPVLLTDKRTFDRARPASPINRGQDILIQWGNYGVEADIGTAGTLTAVTDIAADADDGLQVRFEGLTGSGNTARTNIETVTLASSTATTTSSFSAGQGGLRRVTIVPDTVPAAGGGLITITDAGGTTVERLDASREREHQHIRTELFAQSGSSSNYQVSYYRRTFNVTAETDVIEMPSEFQDIMEDGVMLELQKFLGNWEAAMMMEKKRFADLRELVAFSNKQPGIKRTLSTNWARRGLRGRRFS
jgi:hypothetical protein